MPSFGKTSRERLSTCHPAIQKVFNEVIKHFDCTIVEGHRPKEKQDEYYPKKSKVQWPNSKHNSEPSEGIDACPYINGSLSWDRTHCLYFAGFVLGVASQMGIRMRWGGDWDMDNEAVTDQEFQDLVHFELV